MKRSIVVLVLFAFTLAARAQVLPRQDYQCLSQAKKDQFLAALKSIAGRTGTDSWSHPYDNNLKWYQELHNGDASGAFCTHRSEQFMTWHRAMLTIFERAMQKAAGDPSFRLPYWNWVRLPTGKHYPIEFETDPFLQHLRDNSQPARTLYTEAQVQETIRNNANWEKFGGPASGYGALEKDRHNLMHNWVGGMSGGSMTSDKTAAADPLFWLFHCYIDLIFDEWQRTYSYPPVPNPTQPLNKLEGWTAGQTERTESLGYTYDRTSCGPAPPAALAQKRALRTLSEPEESFPVAAMGTGDAPFTFDVTIPPYGFRSAEVKLSGPPFPDDYSYAASLYLYPAGVAFAPADAAFAQKYRVDMFDVWAHRMTAGHPEHDMHGDLFVDATTELSYLAKTAPGSRWKVTVVIDRVYGASGSLSVDEQSQKRKSIHFDGAAIELNRGEEATSE